MFSVILQILLGIGFLMFGYQKFVSEDMKKGFQYFGYSDGFRIFTGFFEILSAIVLFIGIWIKPMATLGGLMIFITMIGAIFTHLKMKDGFKNMLMPIALLLLGGIVTILNWTALF